jgi:L-lactate dehydrogenase (cytochrome)
VEWIKKRWGGKIIIKGIMEPEDARWPWIQAPTR